MVEKDIFYCSLVCLASDIISPPRKFRRSSRHFNRRNQLRRAWLHQNQNGYAIQGNLDYKHSSGIYLGASASNVDFGDRKFNDSSSV
ncbi:MAG: hypothetical protein EXR90_00040 [Methyloglobulus sp.]|nr:hypothetical protein [Methyloglobulus sp.]